MSWDYVNLADGEGLTTEEAFEFAEVCRQVDRGSLEGDPDTRVAFEELAKVSLKHQRFRDEMRGRVLNDVSDVEEAVKDIRGELEEMDHESTDELILEGLAEVNDRLAEIADLLRE